MNFVILYEDADFLAIDKPPGVVVNNAESVKVPTVQDWAAHKYALHPGAETIDSEREFYDRAGVVHRIDKETSGILLLAKTPGAFRELQRQFKERVIEKTYVALAHGRMVPERGEINAPVGRLPWNRERFGIVPDGKEAHTYYRVISYVERIEGKELVAMTLVELQPKTGRTHQIRVHLKYINHPIVGDYLYAGRITSRNDRTWAPRVMLHAWKITLSSPSDGRPISITAPMPADIAEIVAGSNNRVQA